MSVSIRKRRVAKGVYLLRFKTQYDLTSTFLRVQEHYEFAKISWPRLHARAIYGLVLIVIHGVNFTRQAAAPAVTWTGRVLTPCS